MCTYGLLWMYLGGITIGYLLGYTFAKVDNIKDRINK